MSSESAETRTQERHVWPAVALTLLASLVSLLLLEARPLDPHEAAGVFPPWWGRGAVIGAAARAGQIVSAGAVPFVVVVRSPTGDAAARLAKAGALLSIDPGPALGCGV